MTENRNSPEVRTSQINSEIESLQMAIEYLLDTNDRLEGTFSSVLRQPEDGLKSEVVEEDLLVPLALTIRNCTKKINSETSRICDVLERVELYR